MKSDQVVLLAGATGAVGQALARTLAERGCQLALPVRRPWQVERLRTVLSDVVDSGPAGSDRCLIGTVADGDSEAAAGFIKGAEDALGPIDSMVSTLGAFHFGRVGEDPAGTAESLFDANLLANHRYARALASRFRRRERGRFVFCGTTGTEPTTGGAGMTLYLASKAALDRYAIGLAEEFAGTAVTVALLALGIVDTEANREAMAGADRKEWTPVDRVAERLAAEVDQPSGAEPISDNFRRLTV